jgi:hypothetical protein
VGGRKVKSDLAGNKTALYSTKHQKSQAKILVTFSDFDCIYSENNASILQTHGFPSGRDRGQLVPALEFYFFVAARL